MRAAALCQSVTIDLDTTDADLLTGNEDPRRDAADLLYRALAALPAPARTGRIRLRADAGYFAGQLARAAGVLGPPHRPPRRRTERRPVRQMPHPAAPPTCA